MLKRPQSAQFLALVFVLIPAFSAGLPRGPFASGLLMIAGLLLLLLRPTSSVPRPFAYAALTLVIGSSLAFLPADWFGRPDWRATVETVGNIALGGMVTPQPWHTLEGLGMLLAGLSFGLFLLCQPVNARTHEYLAGAFTVGVATYAAFSIYAASTGWRHPWDSFGTFGFLPNRNHAGTLLAMGATAGLGPFWSFLERRRWSYFLLLGIAITVIVIAALNYCESRAAVVLLFAGFFVWLAGVFHRNIDRRASVSALVLALFALGVFVTSQTPAMQRLRQAALSSEPLSGSSEQGGAGDSVPLDFRLRLYRDTCHMIADHPLTGIGLGNYRYLSPQYREASLTQALAIHPDNSWLLLAAEAGLPTAAAAAAFVVLAFLRLRGCQQHPSWSVRWSCATAVALFVGHSALDIPAHRAATLLPALFLAGLAFRQSSVHPDKAARSRKASRVFFATSGAAYLMAGAWLGGWVPAAGGKLPSAEIKNAPPFVYGLYQQGLTQEAITLAQSVLAHTPLAADLYFQWGSLELTFQDTEATVDRLFATERILEPHLIQTPLRQAAMWLRIDTDRSLRLFADALERARTQDQHSGGNNARDTFASIIQSTARIPNLSDKLCPLTDNRPDLLLLWSHAASPSAFGLKLHEILSRDPSLANWSPGEQRNLLRLWYRKGDRVALRKQLRERSSLEEAAWPILVGDLARSSQYEQAWRIAETKLHLDTTEPSQEVGTSGRLRVAYLDHKTAVDAVRLAKALLKEGDCEGVLKFAAEAETARVKSPHLSRLASVAAARLTRWPEAWAHLVAMMRAQDPELIPE